MWSHLLESAVVASDAAAFFLLSKRPPTSWSAASSWPVLKAAVDAEALKRGGLVCLLGALAGIVAGTPGGKPGGKTDSTPGGPGGRIAESPTWPKARRMSRLSSWFFKAVCA